MTARRERRSTVSEWQRIHNNPPAEIVEVYNSRGYYNRSTRFDMSSGKHSDPYNQDVNNRNVVQFG